MGKTDEVLIMEVIEGMRESYDELMRNHQQNIYHIAYSFAKSSDAAMDITQNVFLKAYENLKRFRGESQFKTWLMRIAYNESQNWVRKNKKYQPREDMQDLHNEQISSLTQEDEFLASENRTFLLRSLYELNTRYRLAIVLRYFEHYPIRDIAEILDCSEGVVKNMLFRSLQKLRKVLNAVDFGEKNEQ